MHYVQTAGRDGGVALVDGPAAGRSIDELVKSGLPPVGVALQILAAVAGVLDIAEADGLSHGDIGPASVFLDETGAVSVDGYNGVRRRYIAPEQRADAAADRYGLGVLAFALLGHKPMPSFPKERHDDAVYDAILDMQWDDVPEPMIGDVQWFISRLLGREAARRPAALDVWRTFVAFASEFPDDLVAWAASAQNGGGTRRARLAPAPAPTAAPKVGATGPVAVAGALGQKMSFGSGPSNLAKGATGFWTKEDLRRAAEAEDEDEPGAYVPAPGGGGVTGFWSTDQLKAMADGGDAPRPTRSTAASSPAGRSFSSEAGDAGPRPASMPRWEQAPQGGDETMPLNRMNADQEASWIAPVPAELKAARTARPEPLTFQPSQSAHLAAPPPVDFGVSGPVAREVTLESPPEPPPVEWTRYVMMGIGAMLFMSCVGFGLVAGGWYLFLRDAGPAAAPPPAATGLQVAPAAVPVPAPPPAAAEPVVFTVLATGTGNVSCGQATKDLTGGKLEWSFGAGEVPANCKITVDGKEKTLIVSKTRTVECKVEGSILVCAGK